MRLIVAITGASGIPMAERLLEELAKKKAEVLLVISDAGRKVAGHEGSLKKLEKLAGKTYSEGELEAPMASGTFPVDGMIIVPCSMRTLAAVSNGLADNLITRAANVCLKEGRKLVLVPRETPLSLPDCRNIYRAKQAGAEIVLPVLTFYNCRTAGEMTDHIVGKILDRFGIEHKLYRRWGE